MRAFRCICVCLCLSALTACLAFSQAVNGTIVGTVTDATGGALVNAKVTLTETNTRIVHTKLTNDAGVWGFPEMPPGTYEVTVEMVGFKKAVRAGIILEANTSPRVDVQLVPGELNQTIEVAASAPVLQTERADTGRSIDSQTIEELPLGVNRNFQSLLDLVPGTSVETFQHSQFFNASSSLQTNVNGQPRMGNNYQIEGIDNNERTGLLQILITPAEALQTVSVSTTNHDPELGRSTGAVVNALIKSGTNNFHGSAYEFLQNSAFDARSFFNPTVGHLAYNYFGGNLGGPIKRNKVFFFANYLRTEDHEANTNQNNIPDNAFRTGDLSGDPGHIVYDPTTGLQDGSGQGRTPFPGNIIPLSRINPVSLKILSFLPPTNENFSPTSQTNDYFALLPAQKTNNQIDSKVDWNVTDRDRISGRFSFARPVMYQAPIFGDAGGPAQGAFEGSGRQKTYSTGLNYNRSVTPTLLTEVRLGVAHYHNDAFQSDYGKNDSDAVGVPGVNLGPFTSGFVGITINGYSSPLFGYSASLPWDRAEANIDLVNSWTKIAHNHQIKWGIDIRRVRDDLLQDQTFSPRGVITFGTQQTGLQTCTGTSSSGTPTGCTGSSQGLANDFASFLLDVPQKLGRDVNTYFPAFREWEVFAYVADNWQVSPKLTVNLGLRWEFYKPPTPAFPGGFSNYDPSNNTLVIAGIGGNPLDMGLQARYKYFAPRVGLAYRLTPKTVVRAGTGISYTPFPDNTWGYNFPVRSNNQYVSPSGSDNYAPAVLPGGLAPTFQNGFPAPDPVVVPANGIITNVDPTTAQVIIPKNYRNSYIETWNLAVQRELLYGLVLDVAYVGSHGVDTPAQINLNAGQFIGAGSLGQPLLQKYGTTASATVYFQGFSSTYNSLQVKLDRRFKSGFSLTTAFTWQKAMDFESGDDGGLDFYAGQGLRRNYARADFDRTLNFVQSYIYQLPFGPGKHFLSQSLPGKIVGGWQVSGILSWRTGTPLTFTGSNSLNLGSNGTATLDQIAPIQVLGGINTGNPWFSTASFAKAATNVQGSTGRNIFDGPGLFGLNLGISRWIQLREQAKLQFRLETLNTTNTAQFSNPNTGFGSNFGFITGTISSGTGVNGTGGGRVVQLGAKVVF
ncbi:MAG TPA: carboxypeptidase regulatory-like domain-containing protein [Bryobacteraceae bacterium]|nr:carboxypeptidase regulatory-like domain-containing protein [Bryobacteraceae bacterium]